MQVVFVFAWLVSVVPTRIQVRTYVLLRHKRTCLLAPQEDMYYGGAGMHALLCTTKTCLCVAQEDMCLLCQKQATANHTKHIPFKISVRMRMGQIESIPNKQFAMFSNFLI